MKVRPAVRTKPGHRVGAGRGVALRVRPAALIGLLFVGALVLSLVGAGIGAVRIPPVETLHALFGTGEEASSFIVWEYRLPRIALAWLVGSGLAVSGCVIQGVIRNPLAAPDIIGVTGGAGLSAAVLLTLFPSSPLRLVPIAAFLGGLTAAAIIYVLAYRRGISPTRLALVGIAVGAVFNSGIQFLMTRFPFEVNAALTWLTGTLWGRNWDQVVAVLPWVLVLLPVTALLAARLDLLALGDDVATGLGAKVEATRSAALFVAVALASAAVAVSGTIGFVGLIAPSMARRLAGTRHAVAIPVSGLLGTLLVLLADTAGRGIVPPIEIPAGLITSVVGAPYFLFLLRRAGKGPLGA